MSNKKGNDNIEKNTTVNKNNGEKKTKRKERLKNLALGMQRAGNEAAIIKARGSDGLFVGLIINAIGQALYEIGFQAEYFFVKLWRFIAAFFKQLWFVVVAVVRSMLSPLTIFFKGIFRDLTQPFVHFFVGLFTGASAFFGALFKGKNPFKAVARLLKSSKEEGKTVFLRALSYLLPLGAAAIFAFTFLVMFANPFSLAVYSNGEFIGYIESDTVWDNAERRVESRVKAISADQTLELAPSFEIASVDVASRLSATQLTDSIIDKSPEQITQATGIYVNDVLVSVCVEGDDLRSLLDTAIAIATPADDPSARVSFINDVVTEDGLYYTESLSTFAQTESVLNANNYLQTVITVTQVRDVEVAYTEIEEESSNYAKGVTAVKQYGVNGTNRLTEDVTYVSGVEIARTVLSEEVIKEPTPKITYVGTAESAGGSYDGDIQLGTGQFVWPVPGYTYVSSEFGERIPPHRGIDIAAPYGTPIYAIDSGTVVESTWHGSWGYYILINHGNGMTTRYCHASALYATVGTNVAAGTHIADVGNTGTSYGNHLHLEVEVNGGLVNARNYIVEPG